MARRVRASESPYSVRAEQFDDPDLDKLSDLLIRLSLQRAEQERVEQATRRHPDDHLRSGLSEGRR